MKILPALLVALMFHAGAARAQEKGIAFNDSEIPELIRLAKASGKLIFIDVTATWCKPCRQMELTTFLSSHVAEFYNKNFISKKFDLDSDYTDDISLKIKRATTAVPKFYYLDADGNTILLDGGLKSDTALIEMGKRAALNKNVHANLKQMEAKYSSLRTDPSLLLRYMELRRSIGLKNGAILNDYLKLISPEDHLNENIVNTIIDNESELDGAGYLILSDREKQIKASSLNGHAGQLDYRMYKAALEIIEYYLMESIQTINKDLLNKAVEENLRVRQNKKEAQEINKKFLEKFETLR